LIKEDHKLPVPEVAEAEEAAVKEAVVETDHKLEEEEEDSEVVIEADKAEEEVAQEGETEVVIEVAEDHKVREETTTDSVRMVKKSDQLTETEEIETPVMKDKSTLVTTEETELVEAEEEASKVVNSARVPLKIDSTKRRDKKPALLPRTPERKPRRSPRSQKRKKLRLSMVSHSKTTSAPTHCSEPRREEMPKVSERIPRSRPTPRRRHTNKPPRSPTELDTPLPVRELMLPSLLSVLPTWRMRPQLVAEEAEVAEVEEAATMTELSITGTGSKNLERLKRNSHPYEQAEQRSYITKRGK